VKRVLQEGVLIAVIGAALAFAANALSPAACRSPTTISRQEGCAADSGSGHQRDERRSRDDQFTLELLSARFRAEGLQLADSNQAMRLFRDPRREQDGVIFIDARDDDHYRAGHIPGAYLFDRFQPQDYLTNVLQVCLTAQQIVFYCNGGDCDDSEHAAIFLRDSIGIPKEKVFVYGGGINEWTTNGLPIELGSRNSGQFTNVAGAAASGKVEGSKQ